MTSEFLEELLKASGKVYKEGKPHPSEPCPPLSHIMGFVYGGLIEEQKTRIRKHLAICGRCLHDVIDLYNPPQENEVNVSEPTTATAMVKMDRLETPATTETSEWVEAEVVSQPAEGRELVVRPKGGFERVAVALVKSMLKALLWIYQNPKKAAAGTISLSTAAAFLLFSHKPPVKVHPRAPAIVQVTGSYATTHGPEILTVTTSKGEVLYSESFSGHIRFYNKPIDLNGDGYLEVVFGTSDGENAGKIYVYSFDEEFLSGKRDQPLRAPPYNTYHELNFSYFRDDRSGKSYVLHLMVDDIVQDGRPRILTVWTDQLHAGSALTILGMPGKVEDGLARENEYIHPGKLSGKVVTINHRKKILICGNNNALRGTQLPFEANKYYGVIGVLDPHQIWGEAPPYLQNENKGSQEWYGFFEPIGIDVHYDNIRVGNADGDGTEEIFVDLPFAPEPGKTLGSHIFRLDPVTGKFKGESRKDSQWPSPPTYQLYDSRQIWWLGSSEYERRSKEAER